MSLAALIVGCTSLLVSATLFVYTVRTVRTVRSGEGTRD